MITLSNLPTAKLPELPKPNISNAWSVAKHYECLCRVLERAKILFNPLVEGADSTTGYVARVIKDNEGNFTNRISIGKPSGKGNDYTQAYDGPHTVDLDILSCSCIFFQKELAEHGEGTCKHYLAVLYYAENYNYTLSPKNGVFRWEPNNVEISTEMEKAA